MKARLLKERRFLLLCAAFVALALLGYLACRLAALWPELTERLYARGIYPVFAQFFSRVSGLMPCSLSELLLFCLPLLLVWQLVRLLRRRTNWLRCLAGLIALCAGLYAVFSLGWAVNYSRLPYAQIAGLEVRDSTAEELEALCLDLWEDAEAYRAQLTDSAQAYQAEESVVETLSQVPQAYAVASERFAWLGGSYAAPKAALLSLPLAYLNIAGIYSPFTFEAHVNALESSLLLPATACHEAAHLRGFAREDEANYIAYVVCVASGDARFAYSGTLLALIHAGNALYDADRAAYARLCASYSDGLRADLQSYNDNWAPYDGEAAEIQERVNDGYLKFNGQSDGVRSYGRMVDLLLAEKRQREGDDAA